ncbi:MAG: metallophosphoesterase family protein [Labilithrix sp.]|nr:metallophosphoesterase family protein [Labilithrix sp.]
MRRSVFALPVVALGLGAILASPISCSSDETKDPVGAPDAAPVAFTSYRGAGCLYDVAPPERHAFTDLSLDDPSSAGSAPVRVRLGLGGDTVHGAPGYADPSRSAVVTWETPESVRAARLRLGDGPDALGEVHTGYSWTTPTPEGGFGNNEPPTSMHEVHLCGLEPGRTYYYQVGGGSPEVWSATQSFTTVPASGAITVGILGDARDHVDVWQTVQRRMRDRAVNLQVTTGDLVAFGTQQSLYDEWLGAIWKDPADPSRFITLGQQMMVMVAGNHENEAARFFGAFSVPGTGPYAESYSSFDVGSAHVVQFDDQAIALLTEGEQAKAMLKWLDEDLARADANRASVPFVVVVHHRGVFTTSRHADDGDVLDLRKLVVPIYDARHVDLVINGHDHAFERSKPLRAGPDPRGAPAVVAAGEGTVYVVNAGAGAPAYGVSDAPFIETSATYGKGTPYDGLYGVLTLEPRKLSMVSYALSASGNDVVLDTFEIAK